MLRLLCRGKAVPHSFEARISGSRAIEAAARANLLRMTPLKWQLVRTFETLMRFLKLVTPPLAPFENPREQPSSILVIEYWNLGDLAILVPFLRNLRQSFPRARISLLLKAELKHFLEDQGLVNEFIPVRVPWALHWQRWRKYNPFSLDWISLARAILQVRERRFDWAFSGRPDVRNNFLLWLSGARRRIGYGFAGGRGFLTDCVPPDLNRPHRSDLWLHLLEALGASPDRRKSHLLLKASDLSFARSYLAKWGIPADALIVGVHPGARIGIRRWGEDRFGEIALRLSRETDAHILWFNGPGDSLPAPHLQRCHSVTLDFHQFLAVLSRCQLLVCNDSGPMHFANLLNVPVVAVFGPQRPEWYGPRGPRDRVVIRPEFSCRPCWDHCVFDQPYCLRTISVEEVYEAVARQMNAIHSPEQAQVPFLDKPERVSHV